MSAFSIAASLLNASVVTAVVGPRRALSQLPQNTTMPAIVYQIVSTVPDATIGGTATDGAQLLISRVQVTALATTVQGVADLLAAVMLALNFRSGTIGGHSVASVVRDVATPIGRDVEAGVWCGSQDFIMHWWE